MYMYYAHTTTVDTHSIRNGLMLETLACYLVPGDTVYITLGDRVPADIRLIEVRREGGKEGGRKGRWEGERKERKVGGREERKEGGRERGRRGHIFLPPASVHLSLLISSFSPSLCPSFPPSLPPPPL